VRKTFSHGKKYQFLVVDDANHTSSIWSNTHNHITMAPSQPSGSGTGNYNDSASKVEQQKQDRDTRAERRNKLREHKEHLAAIATKPKRAQHHADKNAVAGGDKDASGGSDKEAPVLVADDEPAATGGGSPSPSKSLFAMKDVAADADGIAVTCSDKNTVAGGDKDASSGNDKEAPVLVADDEPAATGGGSPSPSKSIFAMKDVTADADGIAITFSGTNKPIFTPILKKNVVAAVPDIDSRSVHISEKDLPTYPSADDSTRDGQDDDSESTDIYFHFNDGTDDDDDDDDDDFTAAAAAAAAADDDDDYPPRHVSGEESAAKHDKTEDSVEDPNNDSSKVDKKPAGNKQRCVGVEFAANEAGLLASFDKVNNSIEVDRRGDKGRPNAIKHGMLHKYGASIAYVVTFNEAPGDKEIMDSTKPKWKQFSELYNKLMNQNEFTARRFTVGDSGAVQVGNLFGCLRTMHNAGTWDAQNPDESNKKKKMFTKYADELKEWGFLE
jgi:hypothetical protein